MNKHSDYYGITLWRNTGPSQLPWTAYVEGLPYWLRADTLSGLRSLVRSNVPTNKLRPRCS